MIMTAIPWKMTSIPSIMMMDHTPCPEEKNWTFVDSLAMTITQEILMITSTDQVQLERQIQASNLV